MTVSITPRLRPSANEVQERKMENRVRRKKSARDAWAGKGDGGKNELVAREGRIETEIKIVRERERRGVTAVRRTGPERRAVAKQPILFPLLRA